MTIVPRPRMTLLAPGAAILLLLFVGVAPRIILPVGFAALVSLELNANPSLRGRSWVQVFGLFLAYGVSLTWLYAGLSTGDIPSPSGTTANVMVGALAAGAGAFAYAFGAEHATSGSRGRVWWFLLAGFCLLVGFFSSAAGGASGMKQFVVERFGWTVAQVDLCIYIIRKSIHFTFYGTVGLVARAAIGREGGAWFVNPLLFVATLASFDELRQAGIPNRTGSAYDVMLDCAGGATFLAIAVLVSLRKMR